LTMGAFVSLPYFPSFSHRTGCDIHVHKCCRIQCALLNSCFALKKNIVMDVERVRSFCFFVCLFVFVFFFFFFYIYIVSFCFVAFSSLPFSLPRLCFS
jgi:hypothetical protein